jgi:hypothetical protein
LIVKQTSCERTRRVVGAGLRRTPIVSRQAPHPDGRSRTSGMYRPNYYWPLRCRGQQNRARALVVTGTQSVDTVH